jgi:outer membrane protein OmpU
MKKVLFATTALVMTAGFAAADVTISGYGRTGIEYYENDVEGINETIVKSRLRMNIDASTSTDQGIDFGGRVRLQWDQGDGDTTLAPGYIYLQSNGLKVEIGNSNTAFDTAGLMYASEIGIYSRSFGNPRGAFFAYNTDGYPGRQFLTQGVEDRLDDYLGIFAQYTVGDFTVRGSVVNPNQVSSNDPLDKEYGISADYTWNGFELSAAAVQNGLGLDGNDQYFAGARYGFNDVGHVGLLYNDNGDFDIDYTDLNGDPANISANLGTSWTLFGDYTFGLTTVNGYVAHNDADDINETNTAYGIGAKYDLGGAFVAGSIQQDFQERMTADMGVQFNF